VTVTEGSAGATAPCSCGRAIPVPALKELRVRAGLSAYDPSPELVVEHLIRTAELPGGNVCVECGVDTDNVIHIITECERRWVRPLGGTWSLPIPLLPLPIHVIVRDANETREFGRDKVYRLPLVICPVCQRALRGRAGLKKCLRGVAVYDRLLGKYPNARVRLAKA
jgi:hypothetical protein